jgi:hypothetical protein
MFFPLSVMMPCGIFVFVFYYNNYMIWRVQSTQFAAAAKVRVKSSEGLTEGKTLCPLADCHQIISIQVFSLLLNFYCN